MNIDNLKNARKNCGMTQKEVSSSLNISPNTYKNYEQGLREPNGDTIVSIANIFNVSTDYLLGKPTAKAPESAIDRLFAEKSFEEIEEELLRKYMELPHEARMAVVRFLNEATEKAIRRKDAKASEEKKMLVMLRKSLHRVSAGTGYDLNDPDAWENVAVVDCPEARKADYMLEVDGDSMEPTFHDGDVVYVKQSPEVPVGALGVFWVDGCGYIKELGDGCLISHNEKYSPIDLSGTDNHCIGIVLGTAELPE